MGILINYLCMSLSSKTLSTIIIIFFVCSVVALLSYQWGRQSVLKEQKERAPQPTLSEEISPSAPDESVSCTLEAKICPDGSAVGRMPPSCEFAPCP
jgi:hypothetical protein